MIETRICQFCNHLQKNCTGGGLESDIEAHDFTPSCVLPDECHWCGEALDPIDHYTYDFEDQCDVGLYCNENCCNQHLQDIAAEYLDHIKESCGELTPCSELTLQPKIIRE